MNDELQQTVLVAGATGATGRAIARDLAARGVRLALPVRRAWQVDRLRADLADLERGPDQLLVGNVGSFEPESVGGFVKGAEDALGPIDAFVSAVGTFYSGELGREPNGLAEDLFDANLLANHRVARALLPRFRRRGLGRFVFCGAAAERLEIGPEGMALYLASKAALDRYAIQLATETNAQGIRVTLLSLGTLDTPVNREAMPDADPAQWTPMAAVTEAVRVALTEPGSAGPNFARVEV